MSKKTILPQSPHHIQIYDEDWEFLTQAYGPNGIKPIGISTAIRTILHQKVLAVKARAEQVEDEGSGGGSGGYGK